MTTSHTGMKAIRFHAINEKPIAWLAVSRESIEWLLQIVPTDDNAHGELQELLSDEEVTR